MRRAWLVLLVALSVVALASPASAGFVSNARNSELVAEGGWWVGEWGDDTISSGMVGARLSKGAAEAQIWFDESMGTRVVCDAGTPEDPSDDYMGYKWVYRSGWGVGTLDVTKSLGAATANGVVDAWTGQWSDCDYWSSENGAEPQMEQVSVSLTLTADGPRTTSKSGYAFHIPGEYNEHSRSRSVFRSAGGVLTVDGLPSMTQWGQIGEYSWSSHVNGK